MKKPLFSSMKGEAFLGPLSVEAQKLAQSHQDIALRLAWKLYQSSARTMPLDELRGEALYALVYAAGMFEAERGVPFGAYATMVVTHRLIHALTVWRRGGRLAHTRFTDVTASTGTEYDGPCHRTQETLDQIALNDLLDQVRRMLPRRWFQVLQLYYAKGHTLKEVGCLLGISRERVRQLMNKAIVRVRQKMPMYVERIRNW